MSRFFEPLSNSMTPREIFTNQMNYKSFDRSFNREFGWWQENFQTWDIFVDNDIKSWGHANYMFGLDPIDAVAGENWMVPFFTVETIEQKENTYIIRNEDGVLAEVPIDKHGSIPAFSRPTVVTPDDWKRVKQERLNVNSPERIIDIKQIQRVHKANQGRDYPLGVWTGSLIGKIRDMLTFEGLCYAIYDYPDMIEDMVESSCQMVEHSLDQLLPNFKFDYACGWEDIAYKNGPIISPDFFNTILAPRYKRIRSKLSQYGIDIWFFDCDGDVKPLIKGMLDCGINTLFPYEVNANGAIENLLSEYGGELRIMGAVDKMVLIEGREAIKNYLHRIEPLVARGGFIPHCDHLCPPDVNPSNYLYYHELKREMFG